MRNQEKRNREADSYEMTRKSRQLLVEPSNRVGVSGKWIEDQQKANHQ